MRKILLNFFKKKCNIIYYKKGQKRPKKKKKKKKRKGSYFVGVIQPPACGKIEMAYTTSKDLTVAQSLPFGQAEPPLCRRSRGKAAAGHPKGFSSFLFYWFF
jgi:hypothetical protein